MRQAGFTLVEALVAFTILALALGATLPAIATALSQGRTASEASARVLEARSIMESLVGPLAAGTERGRLASGEPWRLDVVALGPERSDAPVVAYRVDLVVGAPERPTLTLSTVRLSVRP